MTSKLGLDFTKVENYKCDKIKNKQNEIKNYYVKPKVNIEQSEEFGCG